MNMAFKCRFLAILSFVCMCVGCKSPVGRILEDVDSYIQERPDSALAVLEAMDTAAIHRPCDLAKYSLLHTMAIDKNYIDTADIRLIMPAVEYYSKHANGESRMKSLFYLGRIHRNAGNSQDAIVAAMKAKQMAEINGDLYWRAMTTSELGYIHGKNYLSVDELKYKKDAAELWIQYGDKTHINQALLNLAMAYHNNRRFEEADSLYAILCSQPDTLFQAYIRRLKNEVERPVKDFKKAVEYFETAYGHNGVNIPLESYFEYAYSLVCIGRSSDAHELLKQLDDYPDDYISNYMRYQIALKEGDWHEAAIRLDDYIHQQDSIVEHQLAQSVFKAQNAQLRFESETEKFKHRITVMGFSLIVLLFLVAFMLSYIIYKRRVDAEAIAYSRLQMLYDESNRMMEAIRVQDEIDRNKSKEEKQTMEDKLLRLRSYFARLYQSHFMAIGRMFDASRGDIDSKMDRVKREYSSKLEAIISSVRKDTRNQAEFERILNEDLGDVMKKLRTDYPKFSEDDFQLLSYLIAGFDATTCSILLDKKQQFIRMKKSRIIQRMQGTATENLDFYLSFLAPHRSRVS